MKEQLSQVGRYANKVRNTLNPVWNGVRWLIEAEREPLNVGSLEEFLRRIDTSDGSTVFLSYECDKLSYDVRRNKGIQSLPSRTKTQFDSIEAEIFSTTWKSKTPLGRSVYFFQKQQVVNTDQWSRMGENARHEAFYRCIAEPIRLARLQHQQHPNMWFMVSDSGGSFQDYSYYLGDQFKDTYWWPKIWAD